MNHKAYASVLGCVVMGAMAAGHAAPRVLAQSPQEAKAMQPASRPMAAASRPITSEVITLTAGDAKLKCFLARPADGGPAPGVLLIHEWWGLNNWVKQQAERMAEKGYVALAVDLYRGEVATDGEHAHELMRGLADERAVSDMKTAFAFLGGHKVNGGKPVGVMGWCMGGGLALKLAIAEPKVACTVICYGRPVTDEEQLKRVRGPILGIWGEKDRGIDIEPFRAALTKVNTRATHHVYPGAGHAFLNETNKRGYNKEQATKAWAEIDGFLNRNLKGT